MRKAFIPILLLLHLHNAYTQTKQQYDSLKNLINSAKDDSTRFYTTEGMIWGYIYSNPDSATLYVQQNILLAQKMKSEHALFIGYAQYSALEQINGNYTEALQYGLRGLRVAERTNNFISEVNRELIQEMKNELNVGNKEEAISIANNIDENEEKISHHGKRADAIVKGMLQHSRSGTGQKEPIDFNALTDEYLRLAYHGLRAKDNSFKATMTTDFDNEIEKINIVRQDVGRVLLNLYTNAFYAVNEKKKLQRDNYEPMLSISTKKLNNKVEIRVRDNGSGIPQKVLDKIFQPFFTTKPTGQGTGLGLSLSYDIIKAHGGEIKVDTTEGEFAEFVIQLPIAI